GAGRWRTPPGPTAGSARRTPSRGRAYTRCYGVGRESAKRAATHSATSAVVTSIAATPTRPVAWSPITPVSRDTMMTSTSSGRRSTAFRAWVTYRMGTSGVPGTSTTVAATSTTTAYVP